MRLINCQQGSDEWLAARLGCPSGSQFDKLITSTGAPSASRDTYINQLIAEKLTGEATYVKVTEWMERGTTLEPKARSYYEMASDCRVEEVGFCKHETHECGVSPDGLVGLDGGIEIKCPAPQTHVKYLRDGKFPTAYKQQVQGCLWITGREWWDFVSFHEDMPVLIVRVERDDEYIEKLQAEVLSAVETIESEVTRLKEM